MEKLVKGQIYTGKVKDLGCNGEGIVKIDNFPIFIPFCLTGEEVTYKIVHITKNYAFGELQAVIEPSNDRVKPKCPYFKKCGGCDIQHMNKELQLSFKKSIVENDLKKILGQDIKVDDTVSLNEFEYRNKLALPFGYVKGSNRVVLGFYEKRSHKVVGMNWCPLHGEWHQKLIKAVCEWATNNKVSVYDEKTQKGLLRHLVCRKIDTLSIVFVINGSTLPHLDLLIQELNKEFKDYTIFISKNIRNTNVIFGDTLTKVYGEDIKQNIDGLKINVSPFSFLQVNDQVKDAIYNKVCNFIATSNNDVVELYSGVGILTAQLAKRMPNIKIQAVEIIPEATNDADNLMKDLGFSGRVKNICDDAANFMNTLKLSGGNYSLILDPPRKGCSNEVLEAANNAAFDKIAYISCNPSTLSRDLQILKKEYKILSVTPFDMFPQTRHVETLVLLSK